MGLERSGWVIAVDLGPPVSTHTLVTQQVAAIPDGIAAGQNFPASPFDYFIGLNCRLVIDHLPG
jgi:hypothetical protein